MTAENKGIQFSFEGDGSVHSFYPNGVGEGGDYTFSTIPGWNGGYDFNEVKITVQQDVAQVYTNGAKFGTPITFDAGQIFDRVTFEGITANDRIADVKVRGITTACTGGGGATTSDTTPDGAVPSVSSNLDLVIPYAMYTMPGGLLGSGQTVPIWANLKYVPQGEQHFWTLSGAGIIE